MQILSSFSRFLQTNYQKTSPLNLTATRTKAKEILKIHPQSPYTIQMRFSWAGQIRISPEAPLEKLEVKKHTRVPTLKPTLPH